MDEEFVKKSVTQWFSSKEIQTIPSYKHIKVADNVPDVIAFDETTIRMVECKDDPKRVPEAIGQAIVYQLGAHLVYIAVPRGVSDKHKRILTHLGIGLLEIDNSGKVSETLPADYSEIIDEDILKNSRRWISLIEGKRELIPWWGSLKNVRDIAAFALNGVGDLEEIGKQLESTRKKRLHPDTLLGYAYSAWGYGLVDVDREKRTITPTPIAIKSLKPILGKVGSPLNDNEKSLLRILIWNFVLTRVAWELVESKGEMTIDEIREELTAHPLWLGWKPYGIENFVRHMVELELFEKDRLTRKYKIR